MEMQLKKFALRGMIVLAAVIALCVLFSGTFRSLTTPKVNYATAKNGKFETVIELTGKVVFPDKEEVTVSVPEGLSLTVTKVPVAAGQRIYKGDTLMYTTVTDMENKLATLQQDYDTARSTLETWERKNGNIRLTRNETLWMEAYDEVREAETTELALRLSLLTELNLSDISALTEEAVQDSGALEMYNEWQKSAETMKAAQEKLKGLERYAVAEDVWSVLQQKRDAEKKQRDAEEQMMKIRLLQKNTERICAPHDGYVVEVKKEKGATLSGEEDLLLITPEDKGPVLRAELENRQAVQKGAVVSIPVGDWMRVDTKITGTGVNEEGRSYADAAITSDVTGAMGSVSSMMRKDEIKMKLTSRSKESTCLVEAAAVRSNGNERYVYLGEMENDSIMGSRMVVRKQVVTVLAESGDWVSVNEDLTYGSKVLYMEDRYIEEGYTVMHYE